MSEMLAISGGTPVREVKLRPWPSWPAVSEEEWRRKVEPALREVYLSGTEGLPGPKAAEFARRLAEYCGARFGRVLTHGTDAIAAAVAAVLDLDGWEQGGEVILPNYTFIASASAPLDRRCTLRLVDIDLDNFCIAPETIERAIVPGTTRAIIAVHLGGHPADMSRINAIASKHGIPVIEDCAQAHGARCYGQSIGSIGAIGAFSFQSTKNLTSGEGGAVVTNRAELDARVLAFLDVGRTPTGKRWEYHRLGWNYRPSEYLAALLTVRLEDLDRQTDKRGENAAYLTRQLAGVPGVEAPKVLPYVDRHAYHLYCVLIDPDHFGGHTRGDIVKALGAEGIPAMEGYTIPLSEQPALKKLAERHLEIMKVDDCPNTARACEQSIWLPQYVLLAERSDMDDIATALAKTQSAMAK